MNLDDDVVYRCLRLGPLHERHPGRSRNLVRDHDRPHRPPPCPVLLLSHFILRLTLAGKRNVKRRYSMVQLPGTYRHARSSAPRRIAGRAGARNRRFVSVALDARLGGTLPRIGAAEIRRVVAAAAPRPASDLRMGTERPR